MNTKPTPAAELKVGDTFTVTARRFDTLPNGMPDPTRMVTLTETVTVVARGRTYTDRYGDRYVPLTLHDRHGVRIFDQYADHIYEVQA